MDDLISRQEAIDDVLSIVSSMSVCLTQDECHGMKRMQAAAVAALKELPNARPRFTEQEKEFLCMLFSLCDEMFGTKGSYMEINFSPFGRKELFELSEKLKIDY